MRFSLKRASTCSAQASTSCVLPRSSSARNETPAEPAGDVVGPEMRLEHGGVFADQLLAGTHAHVFLELGELVGSHQRHETHAAGRWRRDARADRIEQRPPQQQSGGGITLDRIGQIGSELAIVALCAPEP